MSSPNPIPTINPNFSEKWRKVVGWEGYEVSSKGRVRSVDRTIRDRYGKPIRLLGKMLSPNSDPDGYLLVALCNTGRRRTRKIHHLVLEAFIGPRPNAASTCRHINGNRADNSAANLAWGTQEENDLDKDVHGTRPRGASHVNSKLGEMDIPRIRESRLFGAKMEDLGKTYGVGSKTIRDVIVGNTWKHL
jgi:hypothetical protein